MQVNTISHKQRKGLAMEDKRTLVSAEGRYSVCMHKEAPVFICLKFILNMYSLPFPVEEAASKATCNMIKNTEDKSSKTLQQTEAFPLSSAITDITMGQAKRNKSTTFHKASFHFCNNSSKDNVMRNYHLLIPTKLHTAGGGAEGQKIIGKKV